MNTVDHVAQAPTDAGTAAGHPRKRVSPWRTLLRGEWLLLRRDPAVGLATLVLVLLAALALAAGQARVAERQAAVQATTAAEAQRLQALTAQLQRIESGAETAPSQPWRDPGNALAVGRGRIAAVMALPPEPLAATAVGLIDLHPPALRVQAGSRDRFLFADEIANPALLASGGFDLNFVVVQLLPLLLLALGYGVLSAEREQGTWPLHRAGNAPPWALPLVRLAMRTAPLLLALSVVTVVGLGLSGAPLGTAGGLLSLAAWAAVLVAYAAFWLALVLWVNSWQRSSAFNATALALAWVLLVLVLPALVTALAQALHPAPSRAEMVQAVREAAVDAERGRDAEDARYAAEHAQPRPPAPAGAAPGAAERRALSLLLQADRRANETLAAHEARIRAQRGFTDAFGLLSPPMLAGAALAEIAGHGHGRLDAFDAAVASFHARWQQHFVAIASRGERLTRAGLATVPQPAAPPSAWSARASSTRVVLAVGIALLGALVLGASARQRLGQRA